MADIGSQRFVRAGSQRFAMQKPKKHGKRAPKKKNPLYTIFLGCFSSKPRAPIKNEFTGFEISMYLSFAYLWIGSMVYTQLYEPQWNPLESVYFLVVSMMTVGYGDLTPTSQLSRVFSTWWVLFGCAVIAAFLMELAHYVILARDDMLAEMRRELVKAANSGRGGYGDAGSAAVARRVAALRSAQERRRKAAARGEAKSTWAVLASWLPALEVEIYVVLYMLAFGGLFAAIEGWTLVDGMYFSIVTAACVGYGDLSPATDLGRWLALVYIPFAVVFVGTNISRLPARLWGEGDTGLDRKLAKLLNADLSLEALCVPRPLPLLLCLL